MSQLQAHPLAAKYPPMDDEWYAEFKADVEANGLNDPIVLYEGKILDGRHRYRACQELGIEPRSVEFVGSPEEAARFVKSKNRQRRHLSAEWRKKEVAELRAQGMTEKEIAKQVGASQPTVHRDLKAVNSGELTAPQQPPPDPPKVRGRDGKKYPARKRRGPPRKQTPAGPPAAWDDLTRQLADVASKVEALGPTPEESKPWDLVQCLERAGHALLGKARDLRKRHHLL